MINSRLPNDNWKPDENLVRNAHDEIIQLYKTNSTKLLHDDAFISACAKIAAFLQDKNAILKLLHRLNAELEKLIPEKSRIDEDTFLDTTKRKQVGILRRYIEKELYQTGFQNTFGKTFGFIPPDKFRQTLKHGLMLKDAFLGNMSHMEFTHPIQWLLIAWQQKETKFLDDTISVIDVFKKLGSDESIIVTNPEERNLWDVITDRIGDSKLNLKVSKDDCRSPENLSYLIQSDQCKAYTLKLLLHARFTKRTTYGQSHLFDKMNKPGKKYQISSLATLHVPGGFKAGKI